MHFKQMPTGMLLQSLQKAHKKAFAQRQSALGMGDLGSPLLLIALLQLDRTGTAPTQRELAQRTHLSPATVAVSLRSMEQGGYICRKQDEKDARCNRIAFTEKGLRAVRMSRDIFEELDTQMLDGFSQEEIGCFHSFVMRILGNLNYELEQPPIQCKEAICND